MRYAYLAALAIPALAALAPRQAVAAPTYTFSNLYGPNVVSLFPRGINDTGQIIGYTSGPGSILLSPSSVPTVLIAPSPAANGFSAAGINNLGQIAGTYFDATSGRTLYAVRDAAGNFGNFSLPLAGGGNTIGGLNDSGQIVGTSFDALRVNTSGFLFSPTTGYSGFDYPTQPDMTVGFGVNDDGTVVGTYDDSSTGFHGFIRDAAGNYTSFTVPSQDGDLRGNTFGQAINNSGYVVGYFATSSGQYGLLRDPSGNLTTISDPNGPNSTQLFGINDAGDIVGTYSDASGGQHGFLATPVAAVPEPASLALLGAGLFGVGLLRRRLKP